MLIIGVIVVIIIIAAVGVFAVHSGSGGKQSGVQSTIVQSNGATTSVSSGAGTTAASTSVAPQTTITSQSFNASLANVSAAFAYLDKGCDLSGVTQIKMTNTAEPGFSQTYIISNSNVTESIDVASASSQPDVTKYNSSTRYYSNLPLEGLCAGSGALSEISMVNGGNTDGKWFTYAYNGITAYYNINVSNPNYVSIESRTPDVVLNKTTINGVFMYKMNVLKKTRSVSALSTFYIPGSDPMTSKSFQTIMNNANTTANAKLFYDGVVAEDPGFASLYGNFSGYENFTTKYGSGMGGIGWENYTYTFG